MIKFDLIVVLLVILFILISLYKDLLGTTFTFVIAVTILGFFKILTPSEILSGFANEQIAVIILLLVLGDIIRQTAIIEVVFDRLFKSARSHRGFLGRMILTIAGFSAFLNNTPLVAVMMPYINTWCKRNEISPSKFLLPLSYAAILGGCATLIGTSTNLIVNGMYIDQKIIPDAQSLNIFEFAWVGVPMIIIGFFYLVLFSDKLLPTRPDLLADFSQNSRSYIVETEIRRNSHLIGKTISESGFEALKGLYLIEILRDNFKISIVSPELVLQQDDLLIFAGDTQVITEMLNGDSGLTLPSLGMLTKKKQTEVVEIVISHNSKMIGKSVSDIRFRARFDAAVIAIHRNGERISGKLGDIIIKAGDVLLLYTGIDFFQRSTDTHDFYFISKVKDFQKIEPYKIWTLLGGTLLIILLSALHLVNLFMGLIVLLMVVIAMKIAKPKELYKAIDYNLAMIIALSLALGTAMIKSGAADLVADVITRLFIPIGKVGLLFGIYFITAFLAAYITNKAAVAIVFPISIMLAANLSLNPIPFVLVVSFAAAANFMTPHGYQTNLMVYGPGGYTFGNFFKIGFPLTMIYMVVTVIILRLVYL
ncbi:MAG: potassium transporter TrkA [Bacteroidetes bacterium GWF2_33_16]|nr:MAG: potassium transporter TrkA [Bacteroidetes bacterium GWE2_32_14]OFY02966.1 MAG: potassium transporter TrkA [Bacteroidetes bacterium GWF2_33_16]